MSRRRPLKTRAEDFRHVLRLPTRCPVRPPPSSSACRLPAQVRARGRAAAHYCPLCCASFRHFMPGSSAAVRWSRGAADGGAPRFLLRPGTRAHTRGAPAQPGVLITARLPPPPRCLRGPSRRRRLRRVLSPRAHWSLSGGGGGARGACVRCTFTAAAPGPPTHAPLRHTRPATVTTAAPRPRHSLRRQRRSPRWLPTGLVPTCSPPTRAGLHSSTTSATSTPVIVSSPCPAAAATAGRRRIRAARLATRPAWSRTG